MLTTLTSRRVVVTLSTLTPLFLACINTAELPIPPEQVPSALWKLPAEAHAAAIARFRPPTPEQLDQIHAGYRKFAAEFPHRPMKERRVGGRNDYAAALMYLGRAEEAVGELEHTERLFPGDFSIAANLGTAYELAGDVKSARRWIEEGIRRNPEDHLGTEWLHLAILDAKLRLKGDPAWLHEHNVLELQAERDPSETARAIAYQMNERLNFVSSDDPIVADLFYQAGIRTQDHVVQDYLFDRSLRFGELRAGAIRAARRNR
jgi:tetratricopeptide (TPR) repeat protein